MLAPVTNCSLSQLAVQKSVKTTICIGCSLEKEEPVVETLAADALLLLTDDDVAV